MSRLPRLYVPGCSHHLIQRGNNRQQCVIDPLDRSVYMRYLRASAETARVQIHAYAQMTNHVHLLVTPSDAAGCSRMMQSLGTRYVGYFNKRHSRSGTLWEGRYKSTLVDTDNYFYTVCRYIELNPVRAGIVSNPAGYQWSSYQFHALGNHLEILTPHSLYLALGNTQAERCERYQALFTEPLDQEIVDFIRESTNKAWALGSPSFYKALEAVANRRLQSRGHGGDRRSRDLTP